jgi:hypothetical protein
MLRKLLIVLLAAAPLLAHAQRREREHERERYHTEHWVYDDRFHHNHYYPTLGYAVPVLPAGNIALTFRGGGRFFFHSGVWYQPAAGGFVVVRPPRGIVVPVLPPAYTTVWVAGAPYYYANDVYYTQTPGGYAVAEPPMDAPVAQAQPPAPPPLPQPQGAPPAAPGTWYYCDSSKMYYPYVSECKEGWRAVAAAPPK